MLIVAVRYVEKQSSSGTPDVDGIAQLWICPRCGTGQVVQLWFQLTQERVI